MEWELTWGPHLKALQKRAKQTGKTPAPLLNRPRLKVQDGDYHRAFWSLDSGRAMGHSSPDPIPVSEVLAYCELMGIASPADRSKYLRIIQMLDGVYREHWLSKQPKT